jgi:DNA-binding transcriptional LysR family regulator
MDLHRIEIFTAAASAGSFTAAARRLHLSQSAVSQQIKLLEEEIGEALFVRTHQQPKLTPRGERLLLLSLDLLQTWGRFCEHASLGNATPSGKLTVGTSAAATSFLWLAIYREFGLAHPGIELDVRTLPATDASISDLRSGELDVAFVPLPLKLPAIEERVLGMQSAILCASPQHPLTRKRHVTAAELVGQRFVLYEPSTSIRWLANHFFERERFEPKVGLESNDTHLLKAMVEAGYGIGFLPDWGIQRELDERRLVALPLAGAPLRQSLGLIYRRGSVSRVARAFIDFCQSHTHLLPRIAQG